MRTLIKEPIFYVYEHWRSDTGQCFWVGKGYGKRAWNLRRRNARHAAIVQELLVSGVDLEVRFFKEGLLEVDALTVEIERIADLRSRGAPLTNVTDGGAGLSGLRHSPETLEKLRARPRRMGWRHTEAAKSKIGKANSIALKGRKNPEHSRKMRGRKQRPEQGSKISIKLKGRPVSAATREKISKAHTGMKRPPITRERLRVSHLGKRPSEQTRAKMRAAHLDRWSRIRKQEAQLCLL